MSKIILTSGAAPATPSAGTVALYSDAGNTIHFVDENGTDTQLLSTVVVEDTTPQLGGNLDNNGFGISTDGNIVLSFTTGGENAVNWVDIEHATTGLGPIIRVVGADTNIDLDLFAKGTGNVKLDTLAFRDHGANSQVWTVEEDSASTTNALTFDYNSIERFRITPAGPVIIRSLNAPNESSPGTDITMTAGTGNGAAAPGTATLLGGAGSANSKGGDAVVQGGNASDGDGGDVFITPGQLNESGSNGNVIIGLGAEVLTWPTADGTNGQVMTTNGSGILSFTTSLNNVVEDTNPQLGGNLDTTFFDISNDGNVILSFTSGGELAVNWIDVQHETTGLAPIIRVKGADTNIDLKLDTKGTGNIDVSSNKIINVANPTEDQDASTKKYVDDIVGFDLGEFTVAGLPTASSNANGLALATDASGGRTFVRSDGTNWKVIAVEGATVTI